MLKKTSHIWSLKRPSETSKVDVTWFKKMQVLLQL